VTDCVVVFVTVGSREEAERIAEALVTEQLAACVNIVGPIESVYRWNDRVQRDQELLLIIKTGAERLTDVEARVRGLHSYEVPEVIALPITSGSQAYLNWIRGQTRLRGT